MTDLFKETIPSILQTGEEVITPENEKSYVPYVVNKALSYHYDCILWANEMNRRPHIDKLMQYQFLINTIRKYKRPFKKWHKNETPENLEAVQEFFNISVSKAKEALMVLSAAQIEEIKRRINKGGTNETRRVYRNNDS